MCCLLIGGVLKETIRTRMEKVEAEFSHLLVASVNFCSGRNSICRLF